MHTAIDPQNEACPEPAEGNSVFRTPISDRPMSTNATPTGSALTVFDAKLSTLLNSTNESKHVSTANRDMDLKIYDSPIFSVGQWNFSPSKAICVDLQSLRELEGGDLRGIIGSDALGECVLYLDFDHGTMRITKDNVSPPVGMQRLSLYKTTYNAPIVKLDLDGRVMSLVIDTGYNNCFGLRHEIFAGMIADGTIVLKGDATAMGESGKMKSRWGTFTKGQLLGVSLVGLPVMETNKIATIGLGFLLNFNLVVNFKSGDLFYQIREAKPPILAGEMLGAILKFSDGDSYVYSLYPYPSPAQIAGLKVGDRILRLGPLSKAEINSRAIYELCLRHPGEALPVELLRSGEKNSISTQIKLEEYRFIYPPREPH